MSENTDKIKAYLSEKGYSSKLTNEQMDYLAGSPDRLAYFESKLAERERNEQLNTVKDYLLNSYYAPDLDRETFKQLLSDPSKIEQYENDLASDKSHLGENIRIGAVNTLRDLGIASSALFGDNQSVSELNRRKSNDAQLSEILQRTKGGEIAGVPTNQLIQSVTNFAATLPLSFIPGVGQAAYLGEKAAESFGSSYGEAYEQTGDAASAWGYALPNAAVQTAIESIGGVGSKAGLTTVRNMGESALKNTLKSALKSGIDEGLEEIYGTAADTALKWITGLDPDAQIELKDLWTGFFTGSLLGAVAGGGTAAVNNGISASRYNKLTDIQKVFADAAYKADALPELSQAKQVAREYSRLAAEGNPVEPEAILQLNKLLNDDLVKYGLMEQKDVDSWQAKHEKMFQGYINSHMDAAENANSVQNGQSNIDVRADRNYNINRGVNYESDSSGSQQNTADRARPIAEAGGDAGVSESMGPRDNSRVEEIQTQSEQLWEHQAGRNARIQRRPSSSENYNEYEAQSADLETQSPSMVEPRNNRSSGGNINTLSDGEVSLQYESNESNRQQSFFNQQNEIEAGGDAGIQGRPAGTETNRSMAKTVSGLAGRNDSRRIGILPLSDQIKQELSRKGKTYVELKPSESPASFYNDIGRAKQGNKHGAYVAQHTVEEYGDMLLLTGDNGNVGVAVTPDGDIVSVFKNPESSAKGAVSSILLTAIENGGIKLDNFDGWLSDMYANHGFIPVSRCAFNREFAPSDWDYAEFKEPDIIFWMHNGESAETVASKIGNYPEYDFSKIPLFPDYDSAMQYRDEQIERAKASQSGGNSNSNSGGNSSGGTGIAGSSGNRQNQEQNTSQTRRESTSSETQRDQSSPRYRQSPERWTASLDSNNREAVEDVGDIVRDISRSFNLPINTGKVGYINANGVYKVKDEAVRVQVTNALPTISHELGHHLDKQYGLSKLKSIQTAVNMMDPNFAAQYKPAEQRGEAVAEFIRSYLSSRGQAAINYRDFYFDAIEAIRKGPNGEQALEDLNRIARKVNAYMSADLPLRYARGLKSRLDPEHMPVSDRLEKFRVDFQSKWVDSYSYLKRVDGAAQDGGYTGDMTTYKAALYSLNAASTVESMLFNGVSDYQGNIVGESLSQALEKIKPQDMESFNLYLRDRHALEVVSNDKRVFADDKLNDPSALKRQIQRHEKRHPEFVEAAGRVYEYQRNVLWYHGVKNGLISEELYNKLQSMYPDYVPFYRYIEGKTPRAGKKAGFANQRAPIKKLKGSGAEIYDPIENIVMQTNMLVSASMKNAVLQQLAKEYDSADSMGLFMEQVTPDMARRSVSTQGAINKLADRFASENFSKEDAKAVFEDILGDTIVEYAVSPFQDQNIVRVMQNGQARYFRINDAELLNALTALSPKQLPWMIEFLGKITRAFKTFTTGLNPFFANSNFFRDFATGWKYSQAGLLEYSKNLLSAINDIRKKSEAYKQYQAAGGLYSGDVARPKQLKDVLTRMYKQNPVQVERGFKKVVALAHMGGSKLDALIGAVETAPRLAEFKRQRAGGASNVDAVLEAADLTVNFKLSGTEGRALNQIIPYFNAAVQGLYKLSRVMTDANKRKSFLIKSTLSAAILATIQLALVWLNDEEEEYKTLSTYNKNNFFCFSIGNGKFIKIPKARELAWLNSLVERTAEAVFMENSDAFYNFGEYTAQMFLPPGLPTEFNNIETILTAPVRDSIIGSFVELAINEDFKGSPIVPSSMENLEDRLQYDESTTAIAKYIGDFFNISPKQLDHLFSNYFGGLHRALAAVTADSKDWFFGLGRQFIADSAYSNDIVTRFYDERNSWTVKATSYPDNAEYAMQKYRHQSMSAILSELNGIARESDAQTARDIKFNTAALLQEFMSTDAYMTDELMDIYEEVLKKDGSRDNDILPFIRPKAEITLPGDKKAVLSYEDYIELYVQASQEIYAEYDSILSGSGNSESKAKRLKKAKESILERVTDEYVQEYMGKEG